MAKEIWYEVFISSLPQGETQTLQEFSCLREARKFLKKHKLERQLMGQTLHIDKWRMSNGIPEQIKEIE